MDTGEFTATPAGQQRKMLQKAARSKGLTYVSDLDAGLRRHAHGKHFTYTDQRGRVITSARVLGRIRRLAIPPAYHDVWICPDPRGHIQATGVDARGRKQYRYHAEWRAVRDAKKFDRMVQFGSRLPALRRRLRADLALPGLPLPKVIATMVSLLQVTLVRVGNREYARANRSYGLTTLRNHHVRHLPHERMKIQFRGKSGQMQSVELRDRRLARLVRRCQELPGQELFQYLDEAGEPHKVHSGMINDYLRDAMGLLADGTGFTAKDFRTWGGTLHALRLISVLAPPASQAEEKRAMLEVCRGVARRLGNTPAVCRQSYIHPWVFEAWQQKRLPPRKDRSSASSEMERYVLRVLKRQRRARPAREVPVQRQNGTQ